MSENQLRIRGLRDPLPRLILSETPAKELQHQILNVGETATMVGSINEVLRFGQELDVTAWILDMKRLNLTSAVNVAAKIAQKGAVNRENGKNRWHPHFVTCSPEYAGCKLRCVEIVDHIDRIEETPWAATP